MIFVQIIIDSVRIPYILHELNLPETGVYYYRYRKSDVNYD